MASFYLHATSGNGNWSDPNVWRTTDQGATTPATAPAVADNVFATANAGARTLTIDAGVAAQCANFNASGFTGTIAGSAGWLVRGDSTWSSTMTFTYTGTLQLGSTSAAGGLTTGGQTFTGNLTWATTGSRTISGNLTVAGLITWNNTCNFTTTNSSNIYAQGGWKGTAYFNDAATNPSVYLQGGTISGNLPNTTVGCYFDGAVTLESGYDTYHTSVREGTYLLEGPNFVSVTTTDNWTYFVAFTGKINTPNVQWNVVQPVSGTYNLEADWLVNYWQGVSSNGTINGAGYKVKISNDFIAYGATDWDGTFDGFEMIGTGDFATPVTETTGQSNNSTVLIACKVIINTAGTITFYPKTISWGNGCDLTVSGSVVTTGVTFEVAAIGVTLSADIYVPTLKISTPGSLTLMTDFECDTLYMRTAGLTIQHGMELTVNDYLYLNGDNGIGLNNAVYENGSGTNPKLTFLGTMANCSVYHTRFTSIDASSSSIPILNWYGYNSSGTSNIYNVTGENVKPYAVATA